MKVPVPAVQLWKCMYLSVAQNSVRKTCMVGWFRESKYCTLFVRDLITSNSMASVIKDLVNSNFSQFFPQEVEIQWIFHIVFADFFKQPMMEIPYESRGDFPLTGLGVKDRRLRVVEHLGRLGDRFAVGWLVAWYREEDKTTIAKSINL